MLTSVHTCCVVYSVAPRDDSNGRDSLVLDALTCDALEQDGPD